MTIFRASEDVRETTEEVRITLLQPQNFDLDFRDEIWIVKDHVANYGYRISDEAAQQIAFTKKDPELFLKMIDQFAFPIA